jgi:hypothetical protein
MRCSVREQDAIAETRGRKCCQFLRMHGLGVRGNLAQVYAWTDELDLASKQQRSPGRFRTEANHRVRSDRDGHSSPNLAGGQVEGNYCVRRGSNPQPLAPEANALSN